MDFIQSYKHIDNNENTEIHENHENQENPEMKTSDQINLLIKLTVITLAFFFYYYSDMKDDPNKPVLIKYHKINLLDTIKLPENKYYLSNYLKKSNETNETTIENIDYSFNLTYINFKFSLKFKMVKVEYNVAFYDKNENYVPPTTLISQNIHVNCHTEILNTEEKTEAMGDIIDNKYFKCVELFSTNERLKFGIQIYRIKIDDNNPDEYNIDDYFNLIFFNEGQLKFENYKYKDDDYFNPYKLKDNYVAVVKKMNDKRVNQTLKLLKSYINFPFITTKENCLEYENKWFFRNLYNNYFCTCRGGDCVNTKIAQPCKYLFYLHVIDNNRHIYEKTDYLFMDFIFKELVAVDVFPIFTEMLKQGLPVHYITEKINITNNLTEEQKKSSIIFVDRDNATVNGDFLEQFLPLFLRLKAVISSRDGVYMSNLFYNIEYITYIFVGHGVSFFKYFLYGIYRYLNFNQFDKLVIPPSDKLINVAKQYGFKDDEIIKMNLPRWDKYNYIEEKSDNKTILMLFSWRALQKGQNISTFYMDNITYILNNTKLEKELEKNKVTLYFAPHYTTKGICKSEFRRVLKKKQFIKFIDQDDIADILSKTQLVVTDFASIVFDIIYRKKPFVLFIPDAYDPMIYDDYNIDYVELLENLKNDTIKFENKFFNPDDAIKKIIYYINNNFKLDSNLSKFYKTFNFKKGDNMNKFIEYLKNLK